VHDLETMIWIPLHDSDTAPAKLYIQPSSYPVQQQQQFLRTKISPKQYKQLALFFVVT
jgi:hypothetical protein